MPGAPDLLNGAFKLRRRFPGKVTIVFLDCIKLCPVESHDHRPEARVGEW